MAKREVYRIEIPIEASDGYSRQIRSAEKQVTKFEGAIERTARRVNKRLDDLTNGRWSVTLRAVDQASRVALSVSSFISRTANRNYRFILRAVDMASSTIRGIGRMITSIPAVITIALSVVGINKLQEATVGAAMSFEQYEVSMTHWLGGNVKQAKELVKWMGQFADTTPFSSVELFPALTRGIGVSNGDIKQAKDLLRLASDMSALTPDATVSDAMEALADAQMGEMERLKAFNVKFSKKEFDRIGYAGVLKQLATKFEGGANKLAKTSEGIISTLKGYRSSIFRSFGTGFLEPMKPRLDAINKWLENNQDTWGRWKETIRSAGEGASEWAFSKLETGFNFIRDRYLNNDDFRNLDFKGQVSFVLSDINQWWTDKGKPAVSSWWESTGKPWASETGLSIGKAIFDGVVLGITEGLSTIGDLWKNAFEDPSPKSIGGATAATALAGAAGSMILAPFLKMGGALGKGGKWMGGKLGKIGAKPPITNTAATVVATKTPVKGDAYSEAMKRMVGAKPPPAPKGFWSKLGNNKLLKKVPLLGAGLGLISVASAGENERAGIVGGLAGGLAGAKGGALAGAALGSVVPGVGTAIGGAIGGVVGGIGGSFGGEWIANNWDTIKEKAGEAGDWIKDKWSGFSGWFGSTVWTPSKDLAINALNTAVGMWDFGKEKLMTLWTPVSNWFQRTVWTPVSVGAEAVGNWFGSRFEEAKSIVSSIWTPAANWFEENVWSPVSAGAEAIGGAIGEKFEEGYGLVKSAWSAASGWFEENVFGPLRTGFGAIAKEIGEKLDLLKAGAASVGGAVAEKANLTKAGASAALRVFTNRGSKKTGLKTSAYANGGYINQPHFGLVGEAGPEMIIPLSSGRRSRAMELYERTGRMLGIRPYANGGLVGKSVEPLVDTSTYSTPIGSTQASSNKIDVNVELGPMSIILEGLFSKENIETIVREALEKFGFEFASQLREALVNRYA
ncbi:hypothetical protein NCCP2222_01820 [Sporosarcina sp. NCCP-2222]|uniref:hypothetical protein n=1 Tax=Sporosarcina sp. NCCP-2222 TaxID=2935073 RepID=UPI00208A7F4E|nr:hypothetical protein [Sporosarcina sp. NCCP-2222]GKV54235.1 hypothetical protein NCCP2222_01820 [Sporosarcina sp. NCCP-2222]